jgi:hypothetical protein
MKQEPNKLTVPVAGLPRHGTSLMFGKEEAHHVVTHYNSRAGKDKRITSRNEKA